MAWLKFCFVLIAVLTFVHCELPPKTVCGVEKPPEVTKKPEVIIPKPQPETTSPKPQQKSTQNTYPKPLSDPDKDTSNLCLNNHDNIDPKCIAHCNRRGFMDGLCFGLKCTCV